MLFPILDVHGNTPLLRSCFPVRGMNRNLPLSNLKEKLTLGTLVIHQIPHTEPPVTFEGKISDASEMLQFDELILGENEIFDFLMMTRSTLAEKLIIRTQQYSEIQTRLAVDVLSLLENSNALFTEQALNSLWLELKKINHELKIMGESFAKQANFPFNQDDSAENLIFYLEALDKTEKNIDKDLLLKFKQAVNEKNNIYHNLIKACQDPNVLNIYLDGIRNEKISPGFQAIAIFAEDKKIPAFIWTLESKDKNRLTLKFSVLNYDEKLQAVNLIYKDNKFNYLVNKSYLHNMQNCNYKHVLRKFCLPLVEKNYYGHNLIFNAVSGFSADLILPTLFEIGFASKINETDYAGMTALHVFLKFCSTYQQSLVQYLDMDNCDFETYFTTVINYLIDNGIDLSITDNNGDTALRYAKLHQHFIFPHKVFDMENLITNRNQYHSSQASSSGNHTFKFWMNIFNNKPDATTNPSSATRNDDFSP